MPERDQLSDHSDCPGRWQNQQGNDEWYVEIEVDRFSTDEPYVVSLWCETEEDGKAQQTLATLTPAQAREMAACLLDTANNAENAVELVREALNGGTNA